MTRLRRELIYAGCVGTSAAVGTLVAVALLDHWLAVLLLALALATPFALLGETVADRITDPKEPPHGR